MWRFDRWSPPATFIYQNTKLYTVCLKALSNLHTWLQELHALMSWEMPLIVHTTSEVLCEVQRSLKWLYWAVHIKHKQNDDDVIHWHSHSITCITHTVPVQHDTEEGQGKYTHNIMYVQYMNVSFHKWTSAFIDYIHHIWCMYIVMHMHVTVMYSNLQ